MLPRPRRRSHHQIESLPMVYVKRSKALGAGSALATLVLISSLMQSLGKSLSSSHLLFPYRANSKSPRSCPEKGPGSDRLFPAPSCPIIGVSPLVPMHVHMFGCTNSPQPLHPSDLTSRLPEPSTDPSCMQANRLLPLTRLLSLSPLLRLGDRFPLGLLPRLQLRLGKPR